MTQPSDADNMRIAEEALQRAEEALRNIQGEPQFNLKNVNVSSGVIHGRKIRIVTVASEKSQRDIAE